MNKSNLTSKLILGTLVVSMSASVFAGETASRWTRFTDTASSLWKKAPSFPTKEAVKAGLKSAGESVRNTVTTNWNESKTGKAKVVVGGTAAALTTGVVAYYGIKYGTKGAKRAWNALPSRKAALKSEAPLKAEVPAEEPAVVVAPKVDTTKIDCSAFVKALENAVAKKSVSWRCMFVNQALTTLGDASVTTLVTELRTLIKANATETEITTKLGEVKAKLA